MSMSVFIHPAHLMLKGVEETTGLLEVTGLLPVLNKSIFSCWLHSGCAQDLQAEERGSVRRSEGPGWFMLLVWGVSGPDCHWASPRLTAFVDPSQVSFVQHVHIQHVFLTSQTRAQGDTGSRLMAPVGAWGRICSPQKLLCVSQQSGGDTRRQARNPGNVEDL